MKFPKSAVIASLIAVGVSVASANTLFSPTLRQTFDNAALDYVEAAYRAYLGGETDSTRRYSAIRFSAGGWDDLKAVNDSTPCVISNNDSREIAVSWALPEGDVTLHFPTRYDLILGTDRAAIENRFIEGLRKFSARSRREEPVFQSTDLQRVTDSLYRLPGRTYIIPEVNRDCYFMPDSTGDAVPVFAAAMPSESVANLLICSGETAPETNLALTVLKHEYGVTESVETTVENLIQYCESLGCTAYYATETVTDSTLTGSLFLYNANEGYDHVIFLECDTSTLPDGPVSIKGRAGLYIPTSNVDTLFEPYKTDSER